jgi:hypothetical protein
MAALSDSGDNPQRSPESLDEDAKQILFLPYNKQVWIQTGFQDPSNKENRMAYTLDTKVGEILKDTHAVETLEKYAPGVSKNPMIGLAKGMTLKAVISMPQAKQAGLTEDMVLKVLAEINARK